LKIIALYLANFIIDPDKYYTLFENSNLTYYILIDKILILLYTLLNKKFGEAMKVSKSAKEKTKVAIINAAVELIIKQGFKATTLREVAKKAGVSNPTIYNYFPTK
jgi:hypothetical protein